MALHILVGHYNVVGWQLVLINSEHLQSLLFRIQQESGQHGNSSYKVCSIDTYIPTTVGFDLHEEHFSQRHGGTKELGNIPFMLVWKLGLKCSRPKSQPKPKERWKLILCAIGQPRKTLPRTDPHFFGTQSHLSQRFAQDRAKHYVENKWNF